MEPTLAKQPERGPTLITDPGQIAQIFAALQRNDPGGLAQLPKTAIVFSDPNNRLPLTPPVDQVIQIQINNFYFCLPGGPIRDPADITYSGERDHKGPFGGRIVERDGATSGATCLHGYSIQRLSEPFSKFCSNIDSGLLAVGATSVDEVAQLVRDVILTTRLYFDAGRFNQSATEALLKVLNPIRLNLETLALNTYRHLRTQNGYSHRDLFR